MDSEVSSYELNQLYGCSGVTRSLKRRRFSPDCNDRPVTRRFMSRLQFSNVSVSVQNQGLMEMADQLSPGSYRPPAAHVNEEESGEETDSIPGLAPESLDLSVSSEEMRYEEFAKPGEIVDLSDSTSSSAEDLDDSDDGGSDGDEDGGEDGNEADVTIKDVTGSNNNLNGKFVCFNFCFPRCNLTVL